MRAPWIDWRDLGLAWRLALSPLDALALAYGAGARFHRGVYEAGWLRRRQLACRVISVGAVTAGGSGKTPLAAWIALALRRRGRRVALATRGYGRARARGADPVVVSDGNFVHGRVSLCGDEPMLLAAHAPGVPVIVAPDRGVAGLRAVAAFDTEVLVLDDGFQHHRLARDIEVLCVDGSESLAQGRLLPRGALREPLSVVARADAVAIVDGPLREDDAQQLDSLAPHALRFRAARRPLELRSLDGARVDPVEKLAGMAVGLICGVARPAGFRRTVEALGACVVAERRFPDHHRYRESDVRGLAGQAPLWLTTEKDAQKILPNWCWPADVEVLRIAIEVEEPVALVDWLEVRLAAPSRVDRAKKFPRP